MDFLGLAKGKTSGPANVDPNPDTGLSIFHLKSTLPLDVLSGEKNDFVIDNLATNIDAENSLNTDLAMNHLQKLFNDYHRNLSQSNGTEQEGKLYEMLPLFCKVFTSLPPSSMLERMDGILQFAGNVAKLFVKEIKRRAAAAPAEKASLSIWTFLQPFSHAETDCLNDATPPLDGVKQNGWNLLCTLYLLACSTPTTNTNESSAILDILASTGVPSTLVRCLSLFVELPANSRESVSDRSSEGEMREKTLFDAKFLQVTAKICSHPMACHELMQKNDLILLFLTLTTACPVSNGTWKRMAGDILTALSRSGMNSAIVTYLHENQCMELCLTNLNRNIMGMDCSPHQIVDTLVTLFCFLKDSCLVSQQLLEDFRLYNGYDFIIDFVLKIETKADLDAECQEAIRNVLLLLSSLCMCGFKELKPNQKLTESLFTLPGFVMPQPYGNGISVRNLHAFSVFQTLFAKTNNDQVGENILDAVRNIIHSDNANYFILEPQNPLAQFCEQLPHKTTSIQDKYFDILDFVVQQLNYVPCKELISLSILIKTNDSIAFILKCLEALLKILRYDPLYKDVFREVGILEIISSCLAKYSDTFQALGSHESENQASLQNTPNTPNQYRQLYLLIMDLLNLLVNNNNPNATLFRQCRGYKTVYDHVGCAHLRPQALIVIQQLLLLPGGEDDMKVLLESLVNSQYSSDVELKIHVLKTLIYVLRESHRARATFRKVGGFVTVFSLLVSMENSFASSGLINSNWTEIPDKDKYRLLKAIFSSFTVAMRYEPANSKYFSSEVKYENLTETIRSLGPFSLKSTQIRHLKGEESFTEAIIKGDESNLGEEQIGLSDIEKNKFITTFEMIFARSYNHLAPQNDNNCVSVPIQLTQACSIMRYLYDMALDSYERAIIPNKSQCFSRRPTSPCAKPSQNCGEIEAGGIDLASKINGQNATTMHMPLSLNSGDIIIVHPGALISFLNLIPSITGLPDKVCCVRLQLYLMEIVKSLVRTERNQQIMCQSGMLRVILNNFRVALTDTAHTLHPPCQYVFERLASQAISPENLRSFLRPQNGVFTGPATFTQVKCLVSMATAVRGGDIAGPAPGRHGYVVSNMTAPGFVEFDMSTEGFACLYMPALAPRPRSAVTLGGGAVATGPALLGGIGTGERAFPPQSGLTFSTWFCVERFSDKMTDPHPIRLLTVIRCCSDDVKCPNDSKYVCLAVLIKARDRSLFISTKETSLLQHITTPYNGVDQENFGEGLDLGVLAVPEIHKYLVEGCWNHLGIVFSRSVLKNSTVAVFMNGQALASQKIAYISQIPGASCTTSSSSLLTLAPTSVYGYVGTPPAMRRFSKLCWKQGPLHVLEESMSPAQVNAIYSVGPSYIGNFTELRRIDCSTTGDGASVVREDVCFPLVPEEKLLVGLHPSSMSTMTLAKIRKLYNKTDAKSIAKQMNISTHDNETPIKLLHNICGHLLGAARSMGAIFIGYLGIRVFVPKPVACTIFCVGGIPVLLGLLALSDTSEGFYAALKSLVGIAKYNYQAVRELKNIQGYHVLALFFKVKKDLLSNHLLYLTFTLVGTVDSNRLTSSIPNITAFEDILLDFELWNNFGDNLKKFLFEHIYELICDSVEKDNNFSVLQKVGFVQKVVFLLYRNVIADIVHESNHCELLVDKAYVDLILKITSIMLKDDPSAANLLPFGQFIVTLIPDQETNENVYFPHQSLREERSENPTENTQTADPMNAKVSQLKNKILLRNACLDILLSLCHNPLGHRDNLLDYQIENILGFDWIMNFMLSNVHTSSYLRSLRLLITLIGQNETSFNNFVDNNPSSFGHWLENSQSVLNKSLAILLGYNLTSKNVNSATDPREVKVALLSEVNVSALTLLAVLMGKQARLPETYLLLFSWMLNQPIRELPQNIYKLDLDLICRYVFGLAPNKMTSSLLTTPTTTTLDSNCKMARINENVVYLVLSLLQNQNSYNNGPSQYHKYHDDLENKLAGEERDGLDLYNKPANAAMNFLIFLYHNFGEFQSLCFEETFLTHLIAILLETTNLMKEFTRDITIFLLPSDDSKESLDKPDLESDQIVMINRNTNASSPLSKAFINDGESTFTNSPLKRAIKDFIKCILVDSFDTYQTPKNNVLDIILENLPDVCPRSLQCQFQTEILSMTMDHILAIDTNLGGMAHTTNTSSTHLTAPVNQHKQTNVVYFASRMVDKVWQGIYLKSPLPVFDFIVKLMVEAKQKNWSINIDSLYTSLDRLILYLLSQDIETEKDDIMDCLRKIVVYRNHIFSKNTSPDISDFIGSLCYCLLRLKSRSRVEKYNDRTSTKWHIKHVGTAGTGHALDNNTQSAKSDKDISNDEQLSIVLACQKVWEEMYLYKKTIIEDIFKLPCPTSNHAFTYPILENFRPLIYETSKRMWISFVENERKNMSVSATSFFSNTSSAKLNAETTLYTQNKATDFQQKIETSLQKIGSGFGKITKTKVRRNLAFRIDDEASFMTIVNQIRVHISIISDLVDLQYDHFYQSQVVMKRQFAVERWKRLEAELLRERSIWGPPDPDPLDKWMLDPTEGPCRMRKRLIKNPEFYNHYPYRVRRGKVFIGLKDKKPLRHKPPTSLDSQLYYKRSLKRHDSTLLKGLQEEEDTEEERNLDEKMLDITEKIFPTQTPEPLESAEKAKSVALEPFESSNNEESGNVEALALSELIIPSIVTTTPLTEQLPSLMMPDAGTDLERDFRRLSTRIRRSLNVARTLPNTHHGAFQSKFAAPDSSFSKSLDETSANIFEKRNLAPDAGYGDFGKDLKEEMPVEDVKGIEIGTVEVPIPTAIPHERGSFKAGDPKPTVTTTSSPNDPDNQALLRLLGEKETIKSMYRCARVQGLDTFEGLLLFGNYNYYIVDGFTLLKSREIRDIHTLPPHFHDPVIPFSPINHDAKKECHKFSYQDIKEVLKRRYLLQPIGLEIFSEDGRNYLLVFPKTTRDKVFNRFLTLAKGITDNVKDSVSGQRRNANVEPSSFSSSTGGILNSLIGEKSVTDRWVKGEITNFQYLMYLNTLAGRSYNDLMQYPIFPWILSDYNSNSLDLNDPSVFRDLSKPMGAQTPDRLYQFKKRFIEWDDPHGDTPPYHYGTCYSSAMIVASYMVRMEPFAQHFLRLQGGHFDLADRMFHSVGDSWLSSSKHNMADVKELIPEFFYLPDFLVNSNHFDFGTKQSGVILGNVALPPWAKDDPREFIRIHRAALESPYVSAHLNHWIDMIFGYKQTGDSAVNAVNVFHHLFYEGSSDVFLIDDPMEKNAIVGFINNFGQIPCQLFKKPHPAKRVSSLAHNVSITQANISFGSSNSLIHHLDLLTPSPRPIKTLRGAVGQIICANDGASPSSLSGSGNAQHLTYSGIGSGGKLAIKAVEQNKALVRVKPIVASVTSRYNATTNPANSCNCVSWGYPDASIRLGSDNDYDQLMSSSSSSIGSTVLATGVHDILCAVIIDTTTPMLLITGGPDGVIWVRELPTTPATPQTQFGGQENKDINGPGAGCLQPLYAHTSAITCLAACNSQYRMLVSGSRDRSCVIWDLNRSCFVRQLRPLHPAPVAAIHINELSGDFVTCAASWIYVWDINGHPITHLDCSIMALPPLLPTTLLESGQGSCPVKNIPLHSFSYSQSVDSINTNPTPSQCLQILCLTASQANDWDRSNIILTGSNDGFIRVYSIEYAQCPKSPNKEDPENVGRLIKESIAVGGSLTNEEQKEPHPKLGKDESTIFESFSQTDIDMARHEHTELINRAKGGLERATSLKEGCEWKPLLVLRHKMNLPSNDGASITALSLSSDQRAIYAGDSKGRIFVWTLSDNPNHWAADHWLKDDMVSNCPGCNITFHFAERKHHCRNCGRVFCSRCSKYESEIGRLKILKPVRVCKECYFSMKASKSGV